jgi:hypothetical protein
MTVVDGGGRIALAEDGTLTAPLTWSASDRTRVGRVLRSQTIAIPPQVEDLRAAPGVLMGSAGPTFRLVSPVATMVSSIRPVLAWAAMPGARDYEVTVSDVAANYREVFSSLVAANTTSVTAKLERERTYSWQVVARTASGEVKAPSATEGEARFRIVSSDTAEALAQVLEAHPRDHLLLGVRYAEAGLMDEAELEFRRVAEANPEMGWLPLLLRARRIVGNAASQSPQ